MANLTQAHHEIFRRAPDECFATLQDLWEHCRARKHASVDRWHPPQCLKVQPAADLLSLAAGSDGAFALNDWSFTQLCRLSGIAKDTVNRLSPETASRAFGETLPSGRKPLQILTSGQSVRSIHGVSYTRLWDSDLIMTLREFATDFQPPQRAMNGATGLYSGEQDMFCFLIDPLGWAEIEGESFAPGFFVWNSEVGKRSIGMSTFWFQAVCQNHIVWDTVDVTEFSRKHTASAHDSLGDIRRTIDALVRKRDARKDGFVALMRKAMREKLGADAEEVEQVLSKNGINRSVAKEALALAREQGRFTIWTLVDALTRLSAKLQYAGDRTDADQKAAGLLSLAA